VIKLALAWPASTRRSGGGEAPSISPLLYVGVLVFVISPMAAGVGVNGGGFSVFFATRGRFSFGVAGGGIASLSASSWATAVDAIFAVTAAFFCRLRGGCFVSTSCVGATVMGDALTRDERRRDIVADVRQRTMSASWFLTVE
jgi:hypothetical protein